ncbi:LPS assembly protein LptD [Blochmannia endosymbiont of Polyrhachis (Hedomyrma) turneri]|uniref:LPS assembly protein LptD n=1 Tax=Blochmannia endosymbiont of Polyrhachis (Hedomyrma) turneri TaxID=1505596 RepID=UPI00061A7F2B|nr:LPS assembly protein LptD [Blochmannia endosymbiont of Polyrhachis (Hedomyrma) turneri]AKC59712.1 LPS-assembly protein lptD [Blochmannia endosymbiont of Polyrhachis (Hedomyrma) turneri]
MKYSIQHTKKNVIKIFIDITVIILIFYQNIQHSLANPTNTYPLEKNFIQQNPIINEQLINNDTKITIQANQAKFYLDEKQAYFSGNVIVTHHNNILYANEIYLHKQLINNTTPHTILLGTGNICYCNDTINITGKKIQTDFQTKNTDLYSSNFHFIKYQTYGTANHIKQRYNNRYTILKHANLTSCLPKRNYWKITGSQISYDHKKDILDIWNAYFKIKNIPILYIPYLQLSLDHKNHEGFHPPTPEYNNEHGLEIKLPYHFNINQYCYGNISTNLIPQQGIQIKNTIQYLKKLNTGVINLEILNNNQPHNNKHTNQWLLYYNLNNTIHKKWRIKSHYIKINDCNYLQNSTLKQLHPVRNFYTKKTMSCQYTDNLWYINLLYKEFQPLKNNIKNIYNTKPQLNINLYTNKLKPVNFQLFGELTYFKNINHNYPRTTRVHIEPSIIISSNIFNTDSHTKITLKTTHYQQNNIDYYNNTTMHTNKHLTHTINRYIPEFKSNTKIILQKRTQILKKYKQTLEPKFQYLYIPYRNQNNIAIYDTTIFQTNNPNPFEDTLYSGLDRIAPANQLTSNIYTKIYDKNDIEIFNISLGQIYFLKHQNINNDIKKHNPYKKNHNITWIANSNLTIKKSLKIKTNIQYNTHIKQFKSGNAIIEHKKNNNKILQINYCYLNSKYFAKITPELINKDYQKNITQLGIIGNWPISKHWTISGTQFYKTNNKQTINQTIGMQFYTCCWKINTGYERKINIWNKKTNSTKYDNKLLFKVTLYTSNQYLKSESKICDILNISALPYQTIL